MRRSLIAAFLIFASSPLFAAPLVRRLVVHTGRGNRWNGPCPHQFDFVAEITSRHPGQLTVQWIRSDGAAGPAETLTFARANEMGRVYDHWSIARGYRGWEQLRVTDGMGHTNLSGRMTFTNRCR